VVALAAAVLSKQLLPQNHGVLLRRQLLCQQQQRLQVDALEHAGVVLSSGVAVA
jgi:hypothetical protein